MENKIWNELSEESKKKIRREYEDLQGSCEQGRIYELELIFGKENLSPKPQIKNWDDVVEQTGYSVKENFVQLPYGSGDDCIWYQGDKTLKKVVDKVLATFKIAKLIELGYGGMITDEEWEDKDIPKYAIR